MRPTMGYPERLCRGLTDHAGGLSRGLSGSAVLLRHKSEQAAMLVSFLVRFV